LKRARPQLTVIINGGISSLDEAAAHLVHVDGVMLGRAAYQTPSLLAEVDSRFFGDVPADIGQAVENYIAYVEGKLSDGVPLNAMTKHLLGLFHGLPGARLFRRHLSENATKKGADSSVLREALAYVARPRAEASESASARESALAF
jgi:tRNA-dihydrouridine synthase A